MAPFVCAHRGASGTHPENTLPAFEEAAALGCGMVEFDVRATRDGALVLLHDPTVDRTTDGSGNIWDLDLEQVRALDASAGKGDFAGVRMPTLDEALDVFPAAMELNIHVYPGPEDAEAIVDGVCQRIAERGRYATAFIAGSDEVMQLVIARDPRVRRCLLGSQDRAAEYPRIAADMGCGNIQPLHRITTPGLVEEAHALGLVVHPFYADDEAEMRRLIGCGVDGILTNQPARLIDVLARGGGDPLGG